MCFSEACQSSVSLEKSAVYGGKRTGKRENIKWILLLDKLPPNWTLGQRLEVFIKVSAPKTCVNIPANLISWKNNSPFVLCIVDGKITECPVELGIRSKDKVEILSGLNATDKIVMQPQKYLQYSNRKIKK